jgi:2-dehydro-3-deoxygluconokinase
VKRRFNKKRRLVLNAISGHRPHTLPPGPLKVALIRGCMGEPAAGFSQTFVGDALNAAVYLSWLNHDSQVVVDYVTAIGADTFSESMRRLWGDERIGHQHMCVIEGRCRGWPEHVFVLFCPRGLIL